MEGIIRTDRRIYSVPLERATPQMLAAGRRDGAWIDFDEAPDEPVLCVVWSAISPSRFVELSIIATQRARRVVAEEGDDPDRIVESEESPSTEVLQPITAAEQVKRGVLAVLAARHGAVDVLHAPDSMRAATPSGTVARFPPAMLVSFGHRVLALTVSADPFGPAASMR